MYLFFSIAYLISLEIALLTFYLDILVLCVVYMMSSEDKGVVRISVSFPPEIIEEIEDFMKEFNYPNRSKLLQDAVVSFIAEKKAVYDEDTTYIGGLLVVYEHTKRGLEDEVTDIQHNFGHAVVSTMHLHLDKERCFELIALKGKYTDLKNLEKEIQKLKGIINAKLVILTPFP